MAAVTADGPVGHQIADTWFQPAAFQISAANVDWGGNLFTVDASNGHAIWSHDLGP